jgi:hypothetical protein
MNSLENLKNIQEKIWLEKIKKCTTYSLNQLLREIERVTDINSLSYNLINAAIEIEPSIAMLFFRNSKNISEDLYFKAINLNPDSIKHMYSCSKNIKMLAAKLKPNIITEIPNPDRDIIMEAFRCSNFSYDVLSSANLSSLTEEDIEEINNNIIIKDIIE